MYGCPVPQCVTTVYTTVPAEPCYAGPEAYQTYDTAPVYVTEVVRSPVVTVCNAREPVVVYERPCVVETFVPQPLEYRSPRGYVRVARAAPFAAPTITPLVDEDLPDTVVESRFRDRGLKRVIAVIGATGAQGGGLARAILSDPTSPFTVRAITRDVNSEKAKKLAEMGAEVVAADLDDEASLVRAFQGAYGAYLVTDFWQHKSPDKEKVQILNMAHAAKAAGLQHVVWSTLEDTRKWIDISDTRMPTLGGVYKVPHFDAKGEMNRIFDELNIPATFLFTSFYWDNMINFGLGPKRGADGRLVLSLPAGERRLPGIAAEDIGRCAYGIFLGGEPYVGRNVGIAGEVLTGAQMAAVLSKAFGEDVAYNAVAFDDYRSLPFPGAVEMGNMFQFYHDAEADFCAVRKPEEARVLNPRLQTFEQFVASNKDRIPTQ